MATRRTSSSSATWPTVVMPLRPSFSSVFGPTPHSRPTGSGCRNSSSPSGSTTSSPSGLHTPLATLARNLVRATPTEMARPTSASTRARSLAATNFGADQPTQARYVEKRLVDRDGLHQGRGVVKDLEHPPAGLGVGVHPRGDDDQFGTQRPGGTDVHRASHTPSASLVAGGQDHPAPDRHRSTPKFRPVPLLDRGVKRVQVGVKNAGLGGRTHVRERSQCAVAGEGDQPDVGRRCLVESTAGGGRRSTVVMWSSSSPEIPTPTQRCRISSGSQWARARWC